VFSCYSGNNNIDFKDDANYWIDPSDYNVAGDATADLGGESANFTNSKDYWDGGADDAMDADNLLTASVDGGRNPYDDLTATSDFDDFLKNDTGGDALYSKDIAGNSRSSTNADATWDVGASEYVAAGGATYTYSASAAPKILTGAYTRLLGLNRTNAGAI
jgi:hypothetical protein